MKPTYKLILLTLIILLFGTVPVVQAVVPTGDDFSTAETVICGDPPVSYERSIDSAKEVDYYSIVLVAGKVLTIDVDTDGLSSLDSLLEVFDGSGNLIGLSDDNKAPGEDSEDSLVDPYLEITVDVDGTYYLAISASSNTDSNTDVDVGDGVVGTDEVVNTGNTGSYMLFLQCSDPPNPPGPIEDVKVGDLLGATGSNPSSLLDIDLDTAVGSFRFPFPSETGLIADMDYDPISKMLFVATNDGYPGKIVPFDPDKGTTVGGELLYADGGFVALEVAGETLYGVHFTIEDFDTSQVEKYSLVIISQTVDGLGLETVASLAWHVSSLAYHSSEKVLYGVASISSPSDLIKIHLEPEFSIETVHAIQTVGEAALVKVVALDFSHENVLYGVDDSGNLYKLDHSNGQAEPIGLVAGVTDLTFVVGEVPPNEEPVKTLCSSTLTSSNTTTSATDVPKLYKFKLKHNPLHRAIGLFKFKGKAGETVTLKLAPEEEESVEAGDEYAVSSLFESWRKCRGKGRVFLGVRDAIPNVDFRARKKDHIPFDMSADLPEDGYYYVMVIRPLHRFYKADYCLTLESDHPDTEAWQTLDVVWPGDDSEEDTATTSTEAKTAEVQSAELYDEASFDSGDTTLGETTEVVPPLTSSEPVSVTPDSSAVESVVDEGSDQEMQAVEETTVVDDTGEVAPAEEPAAEATDEPAVMGAPSIPEETTVDDTGDIAPAEEPAAEATDEPIVMGASSIPEETTVVDDTGEVAPEKSVDEIPGDSESTDGSGSSAEVAADDSDGAESADGNTSDVVKDEPTEDSTS